MPYDSNTKLQVTILDSRITLKPGDDSFELNFTIKNNSDSSFILYNFKTLYPGGPEPEKQMTPNSAVSNTVFLSKESAWLILDATFLEESEFIKGLKSGKFIQMDSAELFDSLLHKSGERYRERLLVLKKRETWIGKLPVEVDKFWLLNQKAFYDTFGVRLSGESELYLIYNCGRNISNIIDLETVRMDEKNHNAVLFQGYVKSNSIKLIIQE
jgi:hypothetical protein